jgi:hypothetical protein
VPSLLHFTGAALVHWNAIPFHARRERGRSESQYQRPSRPVQTRIRALNSLVLPQLPPCLCVDSTQSGRNTVPCVGRNRAATELHSNNESVSCTAIPHDGDDSGGMEPKREMREDPRDCLSFSLLSLATSKANPAESTCQENPRCWALPKLPTHFQEKRGGIDTLTAERGDAI